MIWLKPLVEDDVSVSWDSGSPSKALSMPGAIGSFKSASLIQVMDWIAEGAAQTLEQTGRLTVVVQDNGPLHLA